MNETSTVLVYCPVCGQLYNLFVKEYLDGLTTSDICHDPLDIDCGGHYHIATKEEIIHGDYS